MISNIFYKALLTWILVGSLVFSGCYVGSTTHIRADRTEYPVSFTNTLHDAEYYILTPENYTVVHEFSFSFHSWHWGIFSDRVRERDISERLNELTALYGGDGIVNLRIAVANSWINGLSLVIKSIGFLGILTGIVLMADWNQIKFASVGVFVTSALAFMAAPGVARIKVSGSVIRMHDEFKPVTNN
jgi:hypothetical protein